jgi:hypothetical protein
MAICKLYSMSFGELLFANSLEVEQEAQVSTSLETRLFIIDSYMLYLIIWHSIYNTFINKIFTSGGSRPPKRSRHNFYV